MAFIRCSSLARITIPKSVNGIGKYAFNNTNITSITFQGTVKGTFGAFSDMGNLEEIYLETGPGTYTRASGTSTTWTKQ